MSMMCQLLALSARQIDLIHATPDLASDVVQVVGSEAVTNNLEAAFASLPEPERTRQRAEYAAARAQLGDTEADPILAAARERVSTLGRLETMLDLQKSWHILHYVFTGHAHDGAAPGAELLSGEPVGSDVGYGPPRLLDVGHTAQFAAFLAAQDIAHLEQRVNLAEMRRLMIYDLPMGAGSRADFLADVRREVAAYYPALRDYLRGAATRRDGLLIWLS
jgi:hypothetical protein